MAKQTVNITLADGKVISLESGRMAKQAGGAVIVRMGDTMVLCTVCAGPEGKANDFFPLTVEYREKFYAVGKIPGGYFKREAKPSDKEVLTCRIIDRPLRPMFPEGYMREVQIVCTVLSADDKHDADTLAVIRASADVMGASMTGADWTWPSSTMASWRPTFALVRRLNLATPSLLSVNDTVGVLYSSIDGRALRRSRPVTPAMRRNR